MLVVFPWAEFSIFFKLKHRLGFVPSSRAVTASWWLLVAWAVLSHCIVLAVTEWQQGVLTPSTVQCYSVVGRFAGEFAAYVGATGSLWKEWSVSDVSASPMTSYNFPAQGRGSRSPCPVPRTPLADTLQAWSPIVKSDWISVLVKETVGFFFFF